MNRSARSSVSLALFLLTLAACAPEIPPTPEVQPVPEPPPEEVDRIVFLIGDAGRARVGEFPILERLRHEVERWSGALGRDSAVVVLNLGDVIYPDGLRDRDAPEFPGDSARLQSQIDIVAGPAAMRHRSLMLFVAGNHDWGKRPRGKGRNRLQNLEEFLEQERGRLGILVELLPPAGEPGPGLVDVGSQLRLLLLDTAWWLLEPEQRSEWRLSLMSGIEEALGTADQRVVVMAAHHPFQSAGPHGGHLSFWSALGVRWLMRRAGALLQDLNSIPYKELDQDLRAVFGRVGPPLLFAGGHEHSLQVYQADQPEEPRFSVVSGSASKLTGVGWAAGQLFAKTAPGYMRLVIRRDGTVDLYVVEGDPDQVICAAREAEQREACIAAAVASYETTFSMRLRSCGGVAAREPQCQVRRVTLPSGGRGD